MQERDDDGYRQVGQPPQYAPPSQQQWAYAPPARAPRRGGRSTTVLMSAGSLVIGLIIGYAAGHSSTTTTTTSSSPIVTAASGPTSAAGAGQSPTAASAPTSSASKAAPAKVGSAIVLTGQGSGEKLTVTLVKMVDPAKSTDQFMQPSAGHHYVSVQLRLVNSGTVAYGDSPGNGARLVDADGQQFDPTIATTAAGPDFGGHVNVAPGATALGVITYEVPDGAKPEQFQFTLDSGFADQTGQWALH